jgi:hypothetical protein
MRESEDGDRQERAQQDGGTLGAGDTEPEKLTGTGPAWPPPPAEEDLPDAPDWLNGRAITSVWRETLTLSAGAAMASLQPQFSHMALGAGWLHAPPIDSDADVDQAIAAKLHIGVRLLPLLASAELLVLEPEDIEIVPPWPSLEHSVAYAAGATLPESPIFLDFEGLDGRPVIWEADTWPLPLNLRGALCWADDGLLSVVPFGSVSGSHPWGGNDYQAWARWVFIQDDRASWPEPGPGDFIADADGRLVPWVDVNEQSVCAHQGAMACNLVNRVLRALWMLEAVGAELVPPQLPRPERRRAKRSGKSIGLVAAGLPKWKLDGADLSGPADGDGDALTAGCPVPTAHARMNQAHLLWHEALAAYDDPEGFVTKLNALLQALRHFEFGITHDLKNHPSVESGWWRRRMSGLVSDARLKWLVDARNDVVHASDLEAHSRAHVRLVGSGIQGRDSQFDVPPGTPARDVARHLNIPGIPEDLREGATLVVERRWSVDGLPGEELLDVLADCYGVVIAVLAEAHEQFGASIETCEKTEEDPCGETTVVPHPSGRMPCMWAGREARTSRRNLLSGAPTRIVAEFHPRPVFDDDEVRRRYFSDGIESVAPGLELRERARRLHGYARRIFKVDGYHLMLAWLFRDGLPAAQVLLEPERHAAKFLIIEQLGAEATRLGGDEVISDHRGVGGPARSGRPDYACSRRAQGGSVGGASHVLFASGREVARVA